MRAQTPLAGALGRPGRLRQGLVLSTLHITQARVRLLQKVRTCSSPCSRPPRSCAAIPCTPKTLSNPVSGRDGYAHHSCSKNRYRNARPSHQCPTLLLQETSASPHHPWPTWCRARIGRAPDGEAPARKLAIAPRRTQLSARRPTTQRTPSPRSRFKPFKSDAKSFKARPTRHAMRPRRAHGQPRPDRPDTRRQPQQNPTRRRSARGRRRPTSDDF